MVPKSQLETSSQWQPPGSLPEKLAAILPLITLIFLILLQGKYFDFGVPTAILALSMATITLLVLRKSSFAMPKIIGPAFGIFLAWVLVSAFASKVPEKSFSAAILYISLFFAFLLGFSLTRTNKKFANWWLSALLVIGLVLVVGYFIADPPDLSTARKFVGPFYWHNQMAAFLMFLIPPAAAYVMLAKKKILAATSLIFFLIAFLLTYSRASWLSLVLAVSPLIFFVRGNLLKNKKLMFGLVLGVVTLFTLVFTLSGLGQRARSIILEVSGKTRTTSGNVRVAAFVASFDMFKGNPMFGVGPGVYGEAYRAFQKVPWLYAKNTHNHFLQVLSEMGVVGFVTFSSIFLGTLYIVIKRTRDISQKFTFQEKTLLACLGIALLASTLHNLLDVDWNWPSLAFLFWFSFGIFWGILSFEKEAIEFSPPTRVIFAILVLAIFGASLALLIFERNTQAALTLLSDKDSDSSRIESYLAPVSAAKFYNSYYLSEGRVLQLEGKPDEAIKYFDKAASLNPYGAEPLYEEGVAYEALGQAKKAAEKYTSAITVNPYSEVRYYSRLAKIQLIAGDEVGAKATLERAVNRAFVYNESYKGFSYLYEYTGYNKDLGAVYLTYAKLLLKEGKLSEARNVAEKAAQIDSQSQEVTKFLDTFKD